MTVFFLKYFGGFTIITGLAFLRKENRDKFYELEKNQSIMLGFLSLIVCLPVVILHNTWTGPWEILVSIMGWSGLLKGFNRIIKIPYLYDWRINKMEKTSKTHGLIAIILGSILVYGGLIN